MINRQALLADLQTVLQRLEADLLARSESAEVPEVRAALEEEYNKAKQAERTALNYEDWRSDAITQAAAAWVLSCVFARFLEDNRLTDPPRISGPTAAGGGDDRLRRARDEHEHYFRSHPTETDREYLLSVFDELAGLPGTRDAFGEHNPLRQLPNWLSGDAAGELLRFCQKIDADTGILIHDFTQASSAESRQPTADSQFDTRFLGDLYQDLSEAARKKYALLQTPDFVEEFILDRTLEPALDEFGLKPSENSGSQPSTLNSQPFKLIDPACGSGHFLLGAFPRILGRWQREEPGTNVRELVQRTLDSIYGVDLNPFAVAIARFRLLLTAMRACGIRRLADAPAFRTHLVCGDSLYHGRQQQRMLAEDWTDEAHYFRAEDDQHLRQILREGTYHAVVANPPYIVPKDRAANQAYRQLYSACHMKYSLAVPFMERIFRLAVDGGFTGQITANSFMKREFGKKLIEKFLPKIDLTHVVDTSGAYIPGHGTPTVILFGLHQKPTSDTIRAVMGIRGEPSTPDDPAQGLVWTAITTQIDEPGSQSEFVSVGDTERDRFGTHPWSIGGGGAAELKELLDAQPHVVLSSLADIGIAVVTLEDDAFVLTNSSFERKKLPAEFGRGFVEGDTARDWMLTGVVDVIYPHDRETFHPVDDPFILQHLWPLRTCLINRLWFRKNMLQRGMKWFEYGHISTDKLRTPLSIVFAFVATHNHFVLDRGGKVFNRSAPAIKLPADATEDDHLALLGLLNSSVACFWMKQVMTGKHKGDGGNAHADPAYQRFEFAGTQLDGFPVPDEQPQALALHIDARVRLDSEVGLASIAGPTGDSLHAARESVMQSRREMTIAAGRP